MCKNHNQVNGKQAVIMLTEARLDTSVCAARVKYLEGQVVSFMNWLNDQGADGKAIVLAINKSTLKILKENPMDEFIWTTSREDSPSLYEVGAENNATYVEVDRVIHLDNGSGVTKDKALDYGDRMDMEEDEHGKYWGMLHNVAYKAWTKTKHEEGEAIFNKATAFCDKLEESFDPEAKRPLPYKLYQVGWKAKKKIDLHRFKLKTISYEQWAYLTNWLNVLLSVDKQFGCEMQNIGGQKFTKEDTLEDVAYEVAQVYYTRD